MFVTSPTKNFEECFTEKFDSNWGILTGSRKLDYWSWPVIHIIPYIGSSFKSKPKCVSLPHAKSTNSTLMYSASTISSPANCTYSSIGIYSLSSLKEEMRFANSLAASFIFNFSHSTSMSKLALQSTSKILDILHLFRMVMVWGIISIHT